MKRVNLVVAAALTCIPQATSVVAQTAISVDGVVESTSGGFKFPDGTVQATTATPNSAPPGDTGQQACWDASGDPIACLGTGQDGELQAGVAWPTPRFMDNGNGTVSDNLTGLIWLKTANCFGAPEWSVAFWVANHLSTGSCGLTDGSAAGDWRLPNINELSSLIDHGEWNPALPSDHPFTNVKSSGYWSSSSRVADPRDAWLVDMEDGFRQLRGKCCHEYNFVWPVRGGP